MSVELEKKIFETYQELKAVNTTLATDTDIIVPDSAPDAGAVVMAEVVPIISDKKIHSNRITLSGRMESRLLYMSEPKEGAPQLKAISTSAPFVHQLEADGADDATFASVKCDIVNVSAEIVNSRKINLKSVAEFESTIVKPAQFCGVVSPRESGLPCRCGKISYCTLSGFAENELEISGEVALSPAGGADAEILKTDVRASGREVKLLKGRPLVKGVITVTVLYADGDGEINTVSGEIPFTQIISIDNVSEESVCEVEYDLAEVGHKLLTDDDGDVTSVEISGIVRATAFVYDRHTESIAEDIYSPRDDLEIVSSRAEASNIAFDSVESHDFSESISLTACPEARKLCGVNVKPYVEGVTVKDGKAEVSGTADVYISYISESELQPVYTHKAELEFKKEISIGDLSENAVISVLCEAENVVCSLPASNSAEIRFSLLFETKATEKTEVVFVSEVIKKDTAVKNEEKTGDVVVCFAKKGESLWDIAKHYRAPVEGVTLLDGTAPDDVLEKDAQLLVLR